jgi:tetratricopeptide (TPR) repeat protein
MSRTNVLYAVAAFALGATTVLVAKTTVTFDPKAYYVGRVLYQSGDTTGGEALFTNVLGGKFGKSDLYRIATAYATAKDWGKAKPLFERAIAMDPGDDTGIMKAACWFNLNGERERAEELFARAFARSPDDVWHYTLSAGSYLGVAPF